MKICCHSVWGRSQSSLCTQRPGKSRVTGSPGKGGVRRYCSLLMSLGCTACGDKAWNAHRHQLCDELRFFTRPLPLFHSALCRLGGAVGAHRGLLLLEMLTPSLWTVLRNSQPERSPSLQGGYIWKPAT